MEVEMGAIRQNSTWEMVDLRDGHRPIGLKWVFKVKKDSKGVVVKNKARLVEKGHVQQKGMNFDEVFTLVARLEIVRLLLALAAQEGWHIHHF